MSVAEVDPTQLQDRDIGRDPPLDAGAPQAPPAIPATTRERSLRMKCATADDEEASDQGGRDHDDEHGGTDADHTVE